MASLPLGDALLILFVHFMPKLAADSFTEEIVDLIFEREKHLFPNDFCHLAK